jgi:heme exporter protein D
MQWNSVGEFFTMGGYALYIWGSFGACALLMIAEPFLAKRRLSQVRQSLIRERLADELESQQRTQ